MPGNFQAVFIVQNNATSSKLEESILETCWLAQKYNVNTLSAKADSFLEHPAQRRGYAQLARSRPCALRILIAALWFPVQHQTAAAPVNANV
jgi:hypothetical protein